MSWEKFILLSVMSQLAGSLGPAAIARRLGWRRGRVEKMLARCRTDGLVSHAAVGCWSISAKGTEELEHIAHCDFMTVEVKNVQQIDAHVVELALMIVGPTNYGAWFVQKIDFDCADWPWLFLSAGLVPLPRNAAGARMLDGRRMRVQLAKGWSQFAVANPIVRFVPLIP